MFYLISKITFDFSAISDMGITVSVVGYTLVFLALLILYIIFQNLPALVYFKARRKHKQKRNIKTGEKEDRYYAGEINAAIGMALYLHFKELHDDENIVLTMHRMKKRYSPWNSKVYNFENFRF
ncbi:MAG: OadG family protein [Bacteroidota bacterium]|nr:OadG family protein [Bacteroidota bacterium]